MGIFDRFLGITTHAVAAPAPVLNDAPSSEQPIARRHSAVNLRCVGLICDVTIEPWDGDGIETRLVASERRAAAITMALSGRTLVISDKWEGTTISMGSTTVVTRGRGGGSVSIHASGGSTVSNINVGGGRIMVNGRDITSAVDAAAGSAEPPARLTVRMPRGKAIALEGMIGRTDIGDVQGPLDIQATASGDVKCGLVTSARIAILGSSDVEIAGVVGGPLSVQVQGSGDVEIGGGVVGDLDVSIMGSGDVTFDGNAERARLSIMGSGDIRVARVVGSLSKSALGSGKIKVSRHD